MTLSDTLWRLGVTHGIGWRAFLAEYPPRILASTSLPRAILQSLFFVLLGGLVGGTGGTQFALVGAVAATMTLFTVVSICDVPGWEVHWGTFHRLRSGVLHPFVSLLVRSVPHLAAGFLSALVGIWTVGPLTGHPGLAADLTPALPLYAVMALTSTAAGLAVGILATPSDNEILASNVLAYAILVGSGAIIPVDRLGPAGWPGEILPMRHGITAVRDLLAGQPWLADALIEVGVGAGWLLVAAAALANRVRAARTRGAEDLS